MVDNKEIFEKEFSHEILFSRKSRILKGHLEQLKGVETDDEVSLVIQRAFAYGEFDDWFRWYRLGCRLIDLEALPKAVAVLANARLISQIKAPMWSKVTMIAHKLLDARTPAGPLLYRRQVERWMPWLREWQSEE